MKLIEIVFLMIVAILALLITFIFQPVVLSADWNLIPGATRETITRWQDNLMWPSLYANYIFGAIATLFWIYQANTFMSESSKKTLQNISLWWLICGFYAFISMAVVISLSFSNNFIGQKGFMPFFFFLLCFSLLDVALMYWLPTAIASPKTMRYIPPGSRQLRSLYEG